MNYINTLEAAEKWGLSTSRVLKLAQGGRIPGAKRISYRWMIPENAEKPADARTKAGKAGSVESPPEPDRFRFPGYEYRALSSFEPPLNEEELVIKSATENVYACRFKEADVILGNLPEKTADRYLRINALYTGCMIDIFRCNSTRFLERYRNLTTELEADFPHKVEMTEFLYEIEATLGVDDYYAHEFQLRSDYDYHESFLPRLANLCAVHLSFSGEMASAFELRVHELNCILLKDSMAYADLVTLQLYLGIAYGELGDTERQKFHLRNALTLAEKYEVYYPAAYHYYHMRTLFKPVITEFSEDFRTRLEGLSAYIHNQYVCFMESLSMNSIYMLLPHSDYIFLNYAVQGLTNKEIASRLHISAGAVGKRYSEIYSRLGVENKAALVELYKHSVAGTALRK